MPGHSVQVALGSNLGDRVAHLRAAVDALLEDGHIERVSSLYESAPMGPQDQGPFLNAVLTLRTGRAPLDLLDRLQKYEASRDRVRGVRWGPRTLDLDILFFGDRILRHPLLTVPHPHWRERSFVRRPLLEIAADRVDPEWGWSVAEVCAATPLGPDPSPVAIHDPSWAFP